MMAEFHEAVHKAVESGVQAGTRGVVLMGDGGTFCSGADLRSSPVFFQPEVGKAMNEVMTTATATLRRSGLISVAAIDGHAVGGGAELATACDFRIMTSDAAMQFVHVTRGVVPGWGGVTRLVDITGRKQALYILASGGRMDAQQAAALQLADAIVEATEQVPLLQHALAFLRPLVHVQPAGGGDANGGADDAPLPVDDLVLATVKATVAAVADSAAVRGADFHSRDAPQPRRGGVRNRGGSVQAVVGGCGTQGVHVAVRSREGEAIV